MLLRNKADKQEFHAPSGIAKALIQTGTVEEVIELPEPPVEVRWHVQQGRFVSDYEAPPIICWSASNGTKGFTESTKGTAHLSARVYIPGQKPTHCPDHIAQDYLRLFAVWAAKSKRRKPATDQVSASTPKIPGVSPWTGTPGGPWRENLEFREKNNG